jgi:hypothetical protein
MTGGGFKIPEHMLPYRGRLSESERTDFVRLWERRTLRSVKAWTSFLLSFAIFFVLIPRYLPEPHPEEVFMRVWNIVMSFILASAVGFLVTRSEIKRVIQSHLTNRSSQPLTGEKISK